MAGKKTLTKVKHLLLNAGYYLLINAAYLSFTETNQYTANITKSDVGLLNIMSNHALPVKLLSSLEFRL